MGGHNLPIPQLDNPVAARGKIEGALSNLETVLKGEDKAAMQAAMKTLNDASAELGKAVYEAACAACHLASLRGKAESTVAIGPDLTDTTWVHGGRPTEVHALINKGVLAKGMPTWGPVLGARKIGEVTAYIMSKHREGEPVVIAPPASP